MKGIYDGLPSSVMVGPYQINVDIMSSDWGDEVARHGDYFERELQIRLGENVPSIAFAKDTVWHELLHAIWRTAHLHPRDNEERICQTLATSLTQVFQDNPILARWLSKSR